MIALARQLLLFAVSLIPTSAIASTAELGAFSSGNLILDGARLGVNVFDISNYPGAFGRPYLSVSTCVTLESVLLYVNSDGGGFQQITLGDIDPSAFTPPAAEFTDTIALTSATLNTSSLTLDDASTFTAVANIGH